KPYFVGFMHCMAELLRKMFDTQVLNFIFDRQDLYESRAVETFHEAEIYLPENLRGRLGQCVYGTRVGVGALQAADLFAHCWHAHFTYGSDMGAERQQAL